MNGLVFYIVMKQCGVHIEGFHWACAQMAVSKLTDSWYPLKQHIDWMRVYYFTYSGPKQTKKQICTMIKKLSPEELTALKL